MKEILKDYPNIKDLLKKVGITILLTGTIIGTGIGAYSIYHVVKSKEIFGEVLSKDFHVKFLNNILSYERDEAFTHRHIIIYSEDEKEMAHYYKFWYESYEFSNGSVISNSTVEKELKDVDDSKISFFNVLKNGRGIIDYTNKVSYSTKSCLIKEFLEMSFCFNPNFSIANYKTKLSNKSLNKNKNYVNVSATFPKDYSLEMSFPLIKDSFILNNIKLFYSIPANIKADIKDYDFNIFNFYYTANYNGEEIFITEIGDYTINTANYTLDQIEKELDSAYYCNVDAMWDAKNK